MAGCASCLHKNVHPNVCSDCLGGTHFKPRNKTNADCIRAMTDEALADFLYATWKEQDAFSKNVCKRCPDTSCQPKCWLNWLNEEVDENG